MISVIIPTYNEEHHIRDTIQQLRQSDHSNLIKEIIIADGGSTDNTIAIAKSENAKAEVSPKKGRSAQMNYGASIANEEILYFLHADTVTPHGFSTDIKEYIDKGYSAGCFMLSFNLNHWFLKANCWFTRFDVDAFHYGDASLFVKNENFERVKGYCESLIIFEDYHIIKQLKKTGLFAIIKKPVITSARKYMVNGVYRMQGIFYLMYFMYSLGFSQNRLVSTYKRLIRQDKL